jgi:hypothetical protein
MKIVIGAIAYLAAVAFVILAAVVGLSSIDRRQSDKAVALAQPAEHRRAERRLRALELAKADADRVPVWIVPTAKYEYTPVPIAQKPKHSPVIRQEARAALPKGRSRADGRLAIERAFGETRTGRGQALGFAASRDNDPFHRD